MKFSVWPSYDRSWEETVTLARFAETHGFDGFWYADHLMPYTADGSPDPGDALECWTVLAAVGAVVPRVRLVSVVSPVSIHHPVLLAKRAITTSHIAGASRTVLGIGAGWQENEHSSYGFELGEPGPRVGRFAEAIEVIHGLLRDDTVTFRGEHYSLTDAPCGPKSLGDLPILVGTKSPRMLRLTARWADEWNTWGDPGLVAKVTEEFMRACEAVDRDPATIRRSAQAMVHLEGTRHADDRPMRDRSLVGNADFLIEQFAAYAAQGLDEFAFPDDTLGDSPEERLDTLARLHDEVVTKVP